MFCSFCVVLTTLVVQGATLRPLMKRLGLRADDAVKREVHIARAETARVALRVLDEQKPRSPAADILATEYEWRLRAADSSAAPGDDASLAALQLRTVSAQREALTDLRARHLIGDDAFHVVEEEIDLLELAADARAADE